MSELRHDLTRNGEFAASVSENGKSRSRALLGMTFCGDVASRENTERGVSEATY
jgi:hypothetical protein